jgi:hypothetical protein
LVRLGILSYDDDDDGGGDGDDDYDYDDDDDDNTAIKFSLGGSSPYASTDKTNRNKYT